MDNQRSRSRLLTAAAMNFAVHQSKGGVLLPGSTPTLLKRKAAGANDPCPCGSGKKYKKCCLSKTAGNNVATKTPPKQKHQQVDVVDEDTCPENLPAAAMLRAGIPAAHVYAFMQTGQLIHDDNRAAYAATALAAWDAEVQNYNAAPDGDKQQMLEPAVGKPQKENNGK